MLVEAHNACDWAELWRIVSMRDGCVFKTEFSGRHIRQEEEAPEGFLKVSVSCGPGSVIEVFPGLP